MARAAGASPRPTGDGAPSRRCGKGGGSKPPPYGGRCARMGAARAAGASPRPTGDGAHVWGLRGRREQAPTLRGWWLRMYGGLRGRREQAPALRWAVRRRGGAARAAGASPRPTEVGGAARRFVTFLLCQIRHFPQYVHFTEWPSFFYNKIKTARFMAARPINMFVSILHVAGQYAVWQGFSAIKK